MIRGLRRFWTGSIRRQLILGIALVHALLMSIFVLDLVYRQSSFLVAQSREQATALAQALAANASSWMLASDYVGIEELIASQSAYPGLRYAMLLDTRGRVLGYTDREAVGRYVDDDISRMVLSGPPEPRSLIDDNLLIDVAHPVWAGEQLIGWARVGVSRAGIARSLNAVGVEGLLYTLVAIGVGVLFAILMARGLTRDMHKLADAMDGVAAGARTVDLRLERPDELGRLAQDLRTMTAALNRQERELTAARDALQGSEQRLALALDGANDGLWDWDLKHNTVFYSKRWRDMLGCGDGTEDSPDFWQGRLHPDDLAPTQALVEAHLRGETHDFHAHFRMRHADGSWRWIMSRGRALRDDSGTPYRFVGTHADMTRQRQLEVSLQAERERALVTLGSIGDGVITTLADGTVDYMNPVAQQLTGWHVDAARGKPLAAVYRVLDSRTSLRLENPVQRCLAEDRGVGVGVDRKLLSQDGRCIAVEDSAAPIRDRRGRIIGVVLVLRDATEARRLQREVEHRATHDALTGLWNRYAFEKRLKTITKDAMAGDGRHALIYIDLDQFKVINDTLGHVAGDVLLRQVAQLLRSTAGEAAMVARLGGDEFGALMPEAQIAAASRLGQRMLDALSAHRFEWHGHGFPVSASIGTAEINDELRLHNVLALADLACYGAKEEGRNRVRLYRASDPFLNRRQREMRWVNRVERAVAEDRLALFSQPILPLAGGDASMRPYSEILLRLREPDGRLIAPGEFIPAAERYGIMPGVDRWVVRNVCSWLRDPSRRDECISVNLSGNSVSDPDFIAFFEEQLEGLPAPGNLCVEITETAAIANLNSAIRFMQRLREREVRFSLDDFGSGLSSLNYLTRLPVDCVKIDGHFIRRITGEPVHATIVGAIARIARELRIKTVAEFVEDEATCALLRELGIDYAQGYHLGRPAPLLRETTGGLVRQAAEA